MFSNETVGGGTEHSILEINITSLTTEIEKEFENEKEILTQSPPDTKATTEKLYGNLQE